MNRKSSLPEHIAVIMDGNGRWAKKKNLPRIMGHKEGAKSVRIITEACAEKGIKYLTFYAFSTENWKRPEKEIKFLMRLLNEYLVKEVKTIMKNNIRFNTIGDISALDSGIREKIKELKKKSSKNTGLVMTLALNYGSRAEITRAVKKIASEVKNKKTEIKDIDENFISRRLYTDKMPDPDLLIRTSGEMRISNYLLWQLAYSEIYVTPVMWPEFRKKDLAAALDAYSKRNRRFGGIE
ncbi:MAG: isoprenyl transferase [Candidatus Goldiibacteriota bacterium]